MKKSMKEMLANFKKKKEEDDKIIKANEEKYNNFGKIEVIYHLGDIHIPGNPERGEEYESVLERTVKMIKKEEKKKMIVIAGDLFHDKTKPYQEANVLARKFIKKLGDICEVVIIQGNHDVNIDNESRTDSIESTLCELETKNKIHYLTENKIYEINGINFGLTKMTNETVTPIIKKNGARLYIGLYHGTLYKSKTDENYEFNDVNRIKASDFKGYDIVMLGDVHKYQYMNKEKTIAYSGSLIQQHFGETIKNHGMLLWDLKTKESRLIEIPNDNIFKTHMITDINDTNIPDIEGKKCRLRLRYKKIERNELKKYEKSIKEKYNIIVLIKEEIIDETEKRENIQEENILNKKFMDVYMDFIKIKNMKEDVNVTKKLLELVDGYEKETKKEKKEIKLHNIEFENLLTYGGNNKVNFEKMSGINILNGTNGLGKSSLIDIILFTIYNECSKGIGKDVLNIRYNKGYSILRLELNGKKYTIHRSIRGIDKVSVKLFEGYLSKEEIISEIKKEQKENNNDIDDENGKKNKSLKKAIKFEKQEYNDKNGKNMSNSGKKEIDIQIRELFGTYADMIMTSIILQVGENFIDIKESEKKKLLMKILGLNLFELIKKYCDTEQKKYSSVKLLAKEKELTHLDYDKILLDLITKKGEIQKLLTDVNEEHMFVLKEKHILEHNTSGLNENMEKLNIEEKKIVENINDKNKIIKKLESLLCDKLNEVEKEKLLTEIEQEQQKILEITQNIKNSTNNNMIMIQKEIEETTKKIEEIKSIIEDIENDINDNDEKIEKIYEQNNIEKKDLVKTVKEHEKTQKIIDKKISEKVMLEKTLNIQIENNKYLLEHKFEDDCECCKMNKLIHDKIGYLEKISNIEKEIKQINYSSKDVNDITIKIEMLKKCIELDKNNVLLKTKNENNNTKLLLENNKLEKLNNDILNLNENDKYKKQIDDIKKTILSKKQIIANLNEYIKIINEKKILEENNELIKTKIKKYNDNKENLMRLKKISEDEIKIYSIKTKYEREINNLIDEYVNKKNEHERQKILAEEYKKDIETMNIFKNILDMFNKGFMEYAIIKRLNLLETKMNNIIRTLSNYEIKMSVDKDNIMIHKIVSDVANDIVNDTTNKIQKNKKTNKIKIQKELNIKSLCGYERIVFNISMRLALNNMNIMTKNNFIIIDEGFSGADAVNIHKFPLVLETIKKEYDICILISHIDEIKNQGCNKLRIDYNKNTKDSHICI